MISIIATLLILWAFSCLAVPICRVPTPKSGEYATAAIQRAIYACNQHKGTVEFSPAVYLAASLHINGSVSLHLPEGATLLAGTQVGYTRQPPPTTLFSMQHPSTPFGASARRLSCQQRLLWAQETSLKLISPTMQRADYPGGQQHWYLLRFQGCTGCRLFGGGTIDGQGRAWVEGSLPDRKLVRKFRDPLFSGPFTKQYLQLLVCLAEFSLPSSEISNKCK